VETVPHVNIFRYDGPDSLATVARVADLLDAATLCKLSRRFALLLGWLRLVRAATNQQASASWHAGSIGMHGLRAASRAAIAHSIKWTQSIDTVVILSCPSAAGCVTWHCSHVFDAVLLPTGHAFSHGSQGMHVHHVGFKHGCFGKPGQPDDRRRPAGGR
jgi:hypothetical protein